MKDTIKGIVLAGLLSFSVQAATRQPINRGYLQSNFDGNNRSITNLFILQAGTVIGGEVVGGGRGLSNVVAVAIMPSTSLTNPIIKGGSFAGDLTGSSNGPASSLIYPTNAGTQAIVFGGFVEYRDFGTNAAFAWSGFTGVSHTNIQTTVYFITNSTASVWNMTPPSGMLATNGTWNVTNVTAVTFINNGMKWTNGASYPIK